MAVDAPGSDQPRYDATPWESVRRFWSRYAVFTGRASRSEYWWAALANVLIALVLSVIVVALFVLGATMRDSGSPAAPIATALGGVLAVVLALFLLGQIVPSYAVAIRRLHDADLSGWFVLLGFIPSVGGLILLVLHVLPPNPAGRRFDRDAPRWAPAFAPTPAFAPAIEAPRPAFDAWPPPLEPAPPTSPVPAVPAAEAQQPQDDAVRSAWAELGPVRPIEPPLFAPASWRHCGYVAVGGLPPLVATEGLSRREGVAALGPGAEVYLPGGSDAETPEGWRLAVVATVGRRVAASGMNLPAELEEYGTLSMTVPAVEAPDGWRREDGSLGVLIGLPVADVPEAVATPAGEVRLVSIVPLRPVELQAILDGGTEARRTLAASLAALPVTRLVAEDRPAR